MLSPAIEVLGWTLLHFVWQGAAVGVLAAMSLVAMRRRSANARYLTAVSVLGLMLLLPLGTIAWIEQTSPVGDVSPIFNTVSMIEIPRTKEEDGTLALGEPPIKVERIGIDFENPPPADAVPLIPISDTGQTILEDLAEQRSALRVESYLRPVIPWAVVAWLIGVGVLSLRLLASWLSVQRLRRRATPPASEHWQATLRRIAGRMRVTRPVKLVESVLVEVPTVIGWLRPIILLPASAMTGLTAEQLEALLAHELAHVRRHDCLVNLLQTVVETLLFYHPAVWWLSHRIRLEREHCCDDLAASVCGDPLSYVQALVAMEELRAPKLGLAMSSSGGNLRTRVARLLGQAEQQRLPTGWFAGLLLLLMMAGALSASLLTPLEKPTEGLPNGTPTTATKSNDTNEEASAPTRPQGQETRAEHSPTRNNKEWPQWGRTSHRNNVAEGRLPLDWDLAKGTNVVWKSKLGSETYSSPIVSGGKVLIGTNNAGELNPAYPKQKDLSCLACFDQATGKLLWQYASEKLPAGRSFDWPNIGLCSTACADGDRVWVVTNRCEVVCLDANGFRDGENDGPFREEATQSEIDADVVWKLDMFGELGVRPLHQAASSITKVDGVLLLNTSNGPDDSYQKAAAPLAPNFVALDATNGRVIWKDNSAGESIVVGGSSCMCSGASPSVATLGGVTQAIFTGKEGWVYGYDFNDMKLGKTTLLWKFDCNPKTSFYMLSGRSRRHPLVASPIVADDRVYVATGKNPEHGEGEADLWCIDPTKRGDLSSELVFNKSFENGETPISHKPFCACETDKGDFVRPNPNSGVIWHYGQADRNGNGKIEFAESFHCTMGSPVIHNGLLFIADLSGMMHCLDSKTGEVQWTHDLLAAVYATCVIADGHVLIGDEDGDVEIFKVARTKQSVFGDTPQNFDVSVYATPVVVNGTLFVASKNKLVAIRDPKQMNAFGAGHPTPPNKPTGGLPNDPQPSEIQTNDAPKSETSGRTPAAGSGAPSQVQEVAQKASAVARAEYEKILEANRRVPGSIPDTEVERVRITYEKALLAGVRLAVEHAIAFLKAQQQENGAWQGTPADGVTALAAAALLQAGVTADDPVIQKALAHLRKVEPSFSYTVALQTMVFCLASPKEDAELIRRNVTWLEQAQATDGPNRGAWSYAAKAPNFGDGSCSRFAMLGLHAAKRAGFEVNAETWKNASDYYLSSQKTDSHGWGYVPQAGPTPTMTLAAMAGLAILNQHLPQDEQTKRRTEAIERAVPFVEKSAVDLWRGNFGFYALQSFERAARLNRWSAIGKHELSKLLVEKLLELQSPDGSWPDKLGGSGGFGGGGEQTKEQKEAAEAAARLGRKSRDLIATSFALLALAGQPEPKLVARRFRIEPRDAGKLMQVHSELIHDSVPPRQRYEISGGVRIEAVEPDGSKWRIEADRAIIECFPGVEEKFQLASFGDVWRIQCMGSVMLERGRGDDSKRLKAENIDLDLRENSGFLDSIRSQP